MNSTLPLPKELSKKRLKFNGEMKLAFAMTANMVGAMHLVEKHRQFGFQQSVK